MKAEKRFSGTIARGFMGWRESGDWLLFCLISAINESRRKKSCLSPFLAFVVGGGVVGRDFYFLSLERLCRNVILRRQPKNLCCVTY